MPCITIHDDSGKPIGHACVRMQTRKCSFCGSRAASLLCDFPVDSKKTCDRGMCSQCATRIAADIDYCPLHKGKTPPQLNLFDEVTV